MNGDRNPRLIDPPAPRRPWWSYLGWMFLTALFIVVIMWAGWIAGAR